VKAGLQFLMVWGALIVASCSTPPSDSLIQAQFGPLAGEFTRPNLVFFTPDKEPALAQNELPFVMEVLKGDARKIEARTASGHFFLDRVECMRDGNDPRFPAHYGFAPGLFNVDGDPLDVLVLGEDAKYERMSRTRQIEPSTVRVIGMIQMEECSQPPCSSSNWQNDWKVMAVDPKDPAYEKIDAISELPDETLDRIRRFFSAYKGKDLTRVAGIMDLESTLAYIRKEYKTYGKEDREQEIRVCHALYERTWRSKQLAAVPDEEYLRCLQRVHYAGFMPGTESHEYFLRANAYQRLLQLEHPNAQFEKALEQMEERRRNHLTYYRFVSHDRPSPPGTGEAVFEWVRTPERAKGCPEEFPPQHYESRPLVD
jgi:inorganic pyrophosphatase